MYLCGVCWHEVSFLRIWRGVEVFVSEGGLRAHSFALVIRQHPFEQIVPALRKVGQHII